MDRERLLDLSGRSRKPQIALARAFEADCDLVDSLLSLPTSPADREVFTAVGEALSRSV